MPIVIACPSGHRLKVPSKYQGHRIVCPVCGESISVPGQAVTPVTTPPKKRPAPKPIKSVPLPKPFVTKPTTPEPGAQQPVTPKPSKLDVSIPASPELPAAAEPVAKVGTPDLEQRELMHAFELPPLGEVFTAAPLSDPAPLNMPFLETPQSPLPTMPLFGEEAIEAASMMATQESLFPEIRIDIEHLVEVESRHLVTPADPAQARFYSVLMLAVASILVAVFSLIPSIVEQTAARQTGMRPPDAWSYAVILFAIVQIAISIYAIRIPDWSTVRMVAMVATSLAAIYAAGLSLSMFAKQENSLLRQLGLLDEVFHYRAQPWCFSAMCILLTLAYCCGKYSVGWQQSEIHSEEIQTTLPVAG